jgi:hypothetical protein
MSERHSNSPDVEPDCTENAHDDGIGKNGALVHPHNLSTFRLWIDISLVHVESDQACDSDHFSRAGGDDSHCSAQYL